MQREESLEFSTEVVRHFHWLTEGGFVVQLLERSRVVFCGKNARVTVYHGRSSGEVGVEVILGGGDTSYSMSEIIRLKDRNEAVAYRNPIAVTRDELDTALAQQSERLRRLGYECLRGDDAAIEQLVVNRAKWKDDYELETRLSSAVPKADEAFREGNFGRVVELLSPLERGLSAALLSKLELARKKA